MSVINLSEEEKERARALAVELKEKIERYFPEPPQTERIAEIVFIRHTLKEMGFHVEWEVCIDVGTMRCVAEVTLYLPRADATILSFPKPTSR